MSYQVIARKWRPQAFEEVTGQDHITRTLRNSIEHDRLHHAYVFSGARGVGKTTTARLFAKALNCHKTDKPNPNPCKSGDADICPSCLEITESRSMDVLEIDAASNTGVQNVRDVIVENLNLGPARDRNKIFIIDEVHMLSTQAFNALLKSIEEPPPNVYFVMATTELHKVPDTITSRSQEFVFRTIPQSQIFDRLRLIADAEKVDIDDAALQIIARSGEGSMRDAQSNFDQVISFSGEKIGTSDVSNALGIAAGEVIESVIASLGTGESKAALDVVADLVTRGHDLRVFCREILAVLRDLLMYKVSGDAALVESSVLAEDVLKLHSERFSEADLIRFFHSLAETETRLKDAVQSRYVLEIGLVKLMEMRRVKPLEELIERLAALGSPLGRAASSPSVPESAAAAAPEKKTLTSDAGAETARSSTAETHPEPGPNEPDLGIGYRPLDEPEAIDHFVTEPEFVEERPSISNDQGFVNSLPVKLPPISSEDLEHVEDKNLDALFEQKLEWSGDDLLPIKGADAMAAALSGTPAADRSVANSNGSAAAPARAPLNIQIPDFSAEDEPVELPVLGESPTKEELLQYAKAHPLARKAMRIFRAKITDVALKPKEH
ncbi:MAG: DNA polymerase III subunit gamma/tau [Pyrinomonadaceae bacterium]